MPVMGQRQVDPAEAASKHRPMHYRDRGARLGPKARVSAKSRGPNVPFDLEEPLSMMGGALQMNAFLQQVGGRQ